MNDAMDLERDEILTIFTQTGALLRGHFVLRSGRHSGHFFQCAKVGENLDKITRLAEILLQRIKAEDFETVLAPAMGGLVFGQEVARQAGKRFIFPEKVEDRLVLRRGFKIAPMERILVVEDVVTRGGRVQESLEIIRKEGGVVAGVAAMVNRSDDKALFEAPFMALLELSFPTYPADDLPVELRALPVEKPGS